MLNIGRRALILAGLALGPMLVSLAPASADQTIRGGMMCAKDEDVWAEVTKEAARQALIQWCGDRLARATHHR